MSTPIDVTDATFETEVVKADKPVLVDFWAPWCGPCKAMTPMLKELAKEQAETLKIVKVNVDDEQRYAFKLGVMSVPTLVLFKNGEPIDKMVGAFPKRSIMDRIKPHLATAETP